MSKYIKKVNWPWVEIKDDFDTSMIVNVDNICAVWDNSSTIYKSGIRWKDGAWNDIFPDEALAELKELIMNRNVIKASTVDIERMYENQMFNEWLYEEGQA